jgi:phytoene dehydrogenase-like protein
VNDTYDAVVIGGGHNGLAVAALLAKAERRVVVVEASDRLGGTAQTVEIAPGYRAPAVLHTIDGPTASALSDLDLGKHGLRLLRPPVAAFGVDPEGGGIALHRDPRRTADELKPRSPRDSEVFAHFDADIRAMGGFMALLASVTPPDVEAPSLRDAIAALPLGRAFRRLDPRIRREVLRVVPMAVADVVADALQDELLRATMASRGVALTAMGPWTAGTGAVLLQRAAGGAAGHTVYPEGGPGAVTEALAQAARAFVAEIRTEAEVTGIITSDGRATGVVLASGEEIPARVVVSSADPKRTLELVDPVAVGPTLLWRGRHLRTPGSVSKVNLALSGLPAFRGVGDREHLTGRIVIGPTIDHLERAADDHKYGRISEAPWLELTLPSLTDPTLAPEGGHVASVLCHMTPYHLRKGEWDDAARERVGDLVVRALEEHAPGFSSLVEARQVLTPADLEREYRLTDGCVLHAEPGLDQFFAWRPMLGHARYRFAIPGLYLAGSGAHPGGGITGAPGANAAREILRDLKRRRRRS